MARIPAGENLGGIIARPQRYSEVRIADNGFEAVGAGIQQAALAVGRGNEIALERRNAADRATALDVLSRSRDGLATLHDDTNEGIRTGKIDKTKAGEEWQLRSKESIAAALEGVPQSQRALVQRDLEHTAAKLGRGVNKAVELRDQSDTRAGLQTTLEYAQRLYLTDPKAADQLANDTLDGLGPFSGLSPAQLQAKRQGFKEGTRFNQASSLVNEARRDNATLDKVAARITSDEFADMDPARKTYLLGQIEGFKVANIQKAEAEARRRQAEEERRLRRAESAYNAASEIIMGGAILDEATIKQTTAAVSGTPYEAALKAQLQTASERSAFGVQSLSVMDRRIGELQAYMNVHGTNEQLQKQLKAMKEVRQQAGRGYDEDPLIEGARRGVIEQPSPIDTSSIGGLVATIGERVNQASLVKQQVGQAVSPLLRSEAETVAKTLGVLPLEQRATAVAQIAQTVGPEQAAALSRQLGPKDKALAIAFGMAGARTSQGRYTSELVLRGAAAIKDKSVKEDNAALTGIRARVAAELGDAYPNQELRQTMIDAAVYAEYGLQSEGSGDLSRAVRLVTGGITEQGGRKVPLPYGMPEAEFKKKLANLGPEALRTELPAQQVWVSGTTMTLTDFLKQVPQAALIEAGSGRYGVQTGAGVATNADGRPLIFEVK